MKKSAHAYALLIGITGVLLGAYGLYQFLGGLAVTGAWLELRDMAVLMVLFIICRSLPLVIDEHSTIDMSFICLLAAMLLKGTWATVSMIVLSTPFIFEADYKSTGRKPFTILNVQPIKTFFNMGNPVIAVTVAGLLFSLVGGVAGDIAMPGVLGPLFLFILTVIFLNSAILYALLALNGQVSFIKAFFTDFVSLLPSWIAAAPIGYFFAFLMQMPSGAYISALFMFPLLLARFAFKLYLESRRQYYALIGTLVAAMEAKDLYTKGHSVRVGQYALLIGRAMNLSPKELDLLNNAAVLHDIGKIGIQDEILNKPGALTPEERKIIETHPQIAIQIIGETAISAETKEIILHHHEHYDGKGYPSGGSGAAISTYAYILSVADTFDAITSDRPYRKGRPLEVAMNIIESERGKQFHPDVVDVFLAIRDEVQKTLEEDP